MKAIKFKSNHKKVTFLSCLLFWGSLLFSACHTPISVSSPKEDLNPFKDTTELARARKYYMKFPYTIDSSGVRIPYVKNEWYFPYTRKNPSWLYYVVARNDTLLTVDVDITDCIAQDYMLKENWKAYKETGQTDFYRSHSRYVYTRHLRTGEEDGFYMTIIPSVEYVRKYKERMRMNTYLKRDSCLTGYVLFHTLYGVFVNGWEYKNGKTIAKVSPPKTVDDKEGKKRLLLARRPASYSVRLKHTPLSLSVLPVERRDSILCSISRNLLKENYAKWYRKNMKVLVTQEYFSEKGIDANTYQFTGDVQNEDMFYRVRLLSEKQKRENTNLLYLGEVYIAERTREPFYILLGDGTEHYLLKKES